MIRAPQDAFLAEASRELASIVDDEQALLRVARLAVGRLADGCLIELRAWEDATKGPTQVRAGVGVDLAAALAGGTDRMAMTLPLAFDEGNLGVMVLVRTGRRTPPFTAADLRLGADLAARVAMAVEMARRFRGESVARRRAERALDRIARLQRVTAALSDAVTVVDAADTVLTQAVAAFGAQSGAVAQMTAEPGALQMVRTLGVPEDLRDALQRFTLDIPMPATDAVRTLSPVFIETVADRDSRYPHLMSLHQRTGNGAFAALPLLLDGRALGVMGLTFAEPRTFAPDDREFLVALANKCAQAFERARLLDEARAATRAREEILAIVSHDLRNPLSAITAATAVMARSKRDERDARLMAAIRRAAKRMEALLADLLDTARIDARGLVLQRASCDVTALIREAVELAAGPAEGRELAVDAVIEGDLGFAEWDVERMHQVLGNLIGNAVKFTPAGGRIQVCASRTGAAVRITVTDTGPGIAPEQLAHVFDRYWQADGAGRHGAGLGLSIVKGIVEAHGGHVDVQSVVGQGTAFRVTLHTGTA